METEPTTYRTRVYEAEAIRYTWPNCEAVHRFIYAEHHEEDCNEDSELGVQTHDLGFVYANRGDWIVKDADGFRVMTDAEFRDDFVVSDAGQAS